MIRDKLEHEVQVFADWFFDRKDYTLEDLEEIDEEAVLERTSPIICDIEDLIKRERHG